MKSTPSNAKPAAARAGGGVPPAPENHLRCLDVRADVHGRSNEVIQQRLTKTTWMSGCSSWYLTADGFNASMYPGFATQYLRQMRDFQIADYTAHARSESDAGVALDARPRVVTSTA